VRSILCFALAACSSPAAPPPISTPPPDPPPPPPVRQRADFTVELSPMSVVATRGAIVWTDMAGAIWTMPETGGTPKQLSSQKQPDFAFSLFLAGDEVRASGRHGVLAVSLPDGPVTTLPVEGLPDQPEEAVADREHIYVTIFKRDDVLRIPVAGGKAQLLAKLKRGVLGLHGSTLYVASYATGVLHAVPRSGGTARVIARGFAGPTGVAADATHAFVYTERDQTIWRVELASGERTAIATGLDNADELVLDGDWVYTRAWGKRGKLVRVAKSGSAPETVVDDLRSPYRIAVTADWVYVTSRDDNRIVRIPKR
jgi:hypothetical protein